MPFWGDHFKLNFLIIFILKMYSPQWRGNSTDREQLKVFDKFLGKLTQNMLQKIDKGSVETTTVLNMNYEDHILMHLLYRQAKNNASIVSSNAAMIDKECC